MDKPDWATGVLKRYVEGSPFQLGDRVQFVMASDETITTDDPEDDDAIYVPLGSVGVVVHLDYSCGCGQVYPGEPMIGVALDGWEPLPDNKLPEFWPEELAMMGAPDA